MGENRGGRKEMNSIIDKVKPKSGNVIKLMKAFEKEKDGLASVKLPYRILNRMIGGGLKIGYTSFIAGPPGNGKSFWVYRLLLSLLDSSTAFKYLPLEYDAAEHLRRITAARMKGWDMVSDSKSNADKRMGVFLNHPEERKAFERMEKNIFENPSSVEVVDGIPTVSDVPYGSIIERIMHYSKDNDIIIIDPITAIDPEKSKEGETAQQKTFIKRVKAIAKSHDCHIMMVSHTGKRQKYRGKETSLTMDDMAGTADFGRFCQYQMLLDFHDKKSSNVEVSYGKFEEVEHERTMIIGKSTFGPGKGQKIAFDFTSGAEMSELGWIIND